MTGIYYDDWIDSDDGAIVETVTVIGRQHIVQVQIINSSLIIIVIDALHVQWFKNWQEVKRVFG